MKKPLQRFNSFQELGAYLGRRKEEQGMRKNGRKADEIRPIVIHQGYLKYAEGSVLIEAGNNRIVCSVSIEDRVPPFLKGSGQGWITAEYAMIPRATTTRNIRDSVKGRIGGRSHEIQRLIGRVLRAVVDLSSLGERTFMVDCDVIQADGGTRTLAITGSFVALVEALWGCVDRGILSRGIVRDYLGAVSVGVVEGRELLDLDFEEDSNAEVDMNVVMTGSGKLVEVQGTAERSPFDREALNRLLDLAEKGIKEIIDLEKRLFERGLP
jgi:ribonuclease PH